MHEFTKSPEGLTEHELADFLSRGRKVERWWANCELPGDTKRFLSNLGLSRTRRKTGSLLVLAGEEIIRSRAKLAISPKILCTFSSSEEKRDALPLLEKQGFRVWREINSTAMLDSLEGITIRNRYNQPRPDQVSVSLSSPAWRQANLPDRIPSREFFLDPRELLIPARFDIAMNCLYGRLRAMGQSPRWREAVLYERILRITGPTETIREPGGSGKEGFSAFKKVFDSLLDSDSASWPPVLVDRNLSLHDGAHRVAAAIQRNEPIKVLQVDDISQKSAPLPWFTSRETGHPPLDEDILDSSVVEYARHRLPIAIGLIFPTVPESETAAAELKKVGEVVAEKEFWVSRAGGHRLLTQAYYGGDIANSAVTSAGFMNKVTSCFPRAGIVRAVLIDKIQVAKLRECKQSIRSHYGLGHHSVHISDSWEETFTLVKTVFNKNSRLMLASAIGEPLPGFLEQFAHLKAWQSQTAVDPDTICVTGSAVLSALGLRECRDIDVLTSDTSLPKLPAGLGYHNAYSGLYSREITDMVGDPRLHFYFGGQKFLATEEVERMKENRLEEKDKEDIRLLGRYRSSLAVPVQETKSLKGGKTRVGFLWRIARSLGRKVVKLTTASSGKKRPPGQRAFNRKWKQDSN